MPRYRPKPRFKLDVTALLEAAEPFGDTRQSDVCRRTGIKKDIMSRLWNGRDLSLVTLLRLSEVYAVSANTLALRKHDDEDYREAAA